MALEDLNKGSILSLDRQAEILANVQRDLKEWKRTCPEIWGRHTTEKIDPKKPAWATFATTNPIIIDGEKSRGVRICFAFHKVPCKYKK